MVERSIQKTRNSNQQTPPNLIALLIVGLAIGWWPLEGEPQQPDRIDVFDAPAKLR